MTANSENAISRIFPCNICLDGFLFYAFYPFHIQSASFPFFFFEVQLTEMRLTYSSICLLFSILFHKLFRFLWPYCSMYSITVEYFGVDISIRAREICIFFMIKIAAFTKKKHIKFLYHPCTNSTFLLIYKWVV